MQGNFISESLHEGWTLPRSRRVRDIQTALEEIGELLGEMEYLASTLIVEGPRDVEALRRLGYGGRLNIYSKVSVSDAELVESIAREASSVVILTDFDEEGRRIMGHLKHLFERNGVKVETGLRREFGRLMAAIGIYVIEDLDNAAQRV
ncbi:MAG: toprim domain-containing protein [Candidatus Bathyarchaeota archaeon]|nr:MAG: toprim domain-containing protein [Candidatus Bathyarchaeota archaeon]